MGAQERASIISICAFCLAVLNNRYDYFLQFCTFFIFKIIPDLFQVIFFFQDLDSEGQNEEKLTFDLIYNSSNTPCQSHKFSIYWGKNKNPFTYEKGKHFY